MRAAIFSIPIELIQEKFKIPGAVYGCQLDEVGNLELKVESGILANVNEGCLRPVYRIGERMRVDWDHVYDPEEQTPGPKGLEVPDFPAPQSQTPSPGSDPVKEAEPQSIL